MSISYVLVLLGLGVFGLAVWALFWAVDDGQYDDLEAHGKSILDDDENGDTSPARSDARQPNPDAPVKP